MTDLERALRRESDRREREYLEQMEQIRKDHHRELTTAEEFAERVISASTAFVAEEARASVRT